MQQLPTLTRPPRSQRSRRLWISRRQGAADPRHPIDRRTPSGRLLAY
jgi:hypothetical protein